MSAASIRYVANENGDVHSVDEHHFETYAKTTVRGKSYLRPGWRELTEAEARQANPQLFGARDRNIIHTAKELKEIKERRLLEAELLDELELEPEPDDAGSEDGDGEGDESSEIEPAPVRRPRR